ncbi:MAG: hypothetical protein ACXWDJ_08375 [Aeromicrobium sp.]
MLVTAKGSTVGTVEPSQAGGQQVVVLQVIDGRPGTRYICRVRLDDGTARDAGEWVVPESGHATWIVPGSSTSMERVEVVTDDGRVWSSARLN